MTASAENVVTVDGGVLYLAPVGTPGPVSETDPLDAAFIDLGYWANDGATSTPVPGDSVEITAHTGDVVIRKNKKGNITLQFPFIELNQAVFETYWDTEVQPDGSYSILGGSANREYALVYDKLFSNGEVERRYAPRSSITDRGSVASNENDPETHDITFGTLKHDDFDEQLLGWAPHLVAADAS